MVKTTIVGERVIVKSEYDDGFISKARHIGGKWSKSEMAWVFSVDELDILRTILIDIYGEDGITEEEKTTLCMNLGAYNDKIENIGLYQSFSFLGRNLFRRTARDSGVITHKDVIVCEGSFLPSGGSVKNPRIDNCSGVKVYIKNVPHTIAKSKCEKYPEIFTVKTLKEQKELNTIDIILSNIEGYYGGLTSEEKASIEKALIKISKNREEAV